MILQIVLLSGNFDEIAYLGGAFEGLTMNVESNEHCEKKYEKI